MGHEGHSLSERPLRRDPPRRRDRSPDRPRDFGRRPDRPLPVGDSDPPDSKRRRDDTPPATTRLQAVKDSWRTLRDMFAKGQIDRNSEIAKQLFLYDKSFLKGDWKKPKIHFFRGSQIAGSQKKGEGMRWLTKSHYLPHLETAPRRLSNNRTKANNNIMGAFMIIA